jgi:hypothetical protein
MTIYLPDFNLDNKLYVNDNLSGVTTWQATGYKTYYLQLHSRYSNRNLDSNNDTFLWSPRLVREDFNDRYTTFSVEDITPGFTDMLKSGITDYTIWGSYFEIDNTTTPFDSVIWVNLQDGLAKLETQKTNNMQHGDTSTTVKYKTDPDTAQSYIIYND